MISRMCFRLKMDRPVVLEKENPHYISPGGYNIGGVSFDFCTVEWNRLEDDNSVIVVDVKHLDTDIYPESKKLTLDYFKNHKFEEFYIFTGEYDDPEINPVEILDLELQDDKYNSFIADEEMLKNINEVLCD